MALSINRRPSRIVQNHGATEHSIGQITSAPIGTYAKYIGRVGALAVVLGVGAAVATGYGTGIARADDTGTTAENTTSVDTSTDPSTTGLGDQPGEQTPTSGSGDPAGGDETDSNPSGTDTDVDSSGGQDDSANDDGQSTDDVDAVEDDSDAEAEEANDDKVGDNRGSDRTASTPKNTLPHSNSAGEQRTGTPTRSDVRSASKSAAGDEDSTTATTNAPLQSAFSHSASGGQQSASTTLADTTTTTTVVAPQGLPDTVTRVVTSVVSALLSPFMSGGPTIPAEPPLLLAVLGWVSRETSRAFGTFTPVARTQETSLALAAVNRAPMAYNEHYVASEDTVLTVSGPGVLANDRDPDGDPLTAALVSNAKNGTVTLGPDGGFTYTPKPNFTGPDSFTYNVSDGTAVSNTATVFVHVAAVNDAPVGVPDTYITPKGTKLTVSAFGVLKNDTDVDNPTLSAKLVSGPSHGTLSFSGNGAFTYTPNPSFSGIDTFTYTASDGRLTSAPTTVTIRVGTAPVANPDTATVDEGATAVISVLGNDTDPDGNATIDPTTVTVTGQPAHGTATANADGTITYVSNGDEVTADSFTYTVKDIAGLTSNTATVTISIIPRNDPPNANDDVVTTAEDTAVIGNVLDNDIDADGPLLTTFINAEPNHGTLVFNSDGSFTYTPDANFNGTDSFTYFLADGASSVDLATVSITITPVNDAPTAPPDQDFFTNEDTPVSGNLLTGATDPDGDDLDITTIGSAHHGVLTVDSETGAFTYTPNNVAAGQLEIDTISYTISDGNGGRAAGHLSIHIAGLQDAPVAVDDTATVAEDSGPTTIDVLANDTDPDPGDTLTVTGVAQGVNGTVAITGGGTGVSYSPNANFSGPDSFTYTISDGKGATDTATVNVTVTPVNDPPVTGTYTYTTPQNRIIDIRLSDPNRFGINDFDPEGNTVSVVRIDSFPAHSETFLHRGAGAFLYAVEPGFIGTDSFTYIVTDGAQGFSIGTVTIEVIPPIP